MTAMSGRICLVTGATRGIGRATAEALAKSGAHVLMHGRDSASVGAVCREMVRYGQRVNVIVLPSPDVFLTPRGLEHVGPRAFGYDIDFRSAFVS